MTIEEALTGYPPRPIINRLSYLHGPMPASRPTFIDLFAGCGGFSLGFSMAGWQGLFAIEKEQSAFSTFAANFLRDRSTHRFDWPSWCCRRKRPESSESSERTVHSWKIFRSRVTLVIGGPPCQGFSFAGARSRKDSRNGLFTAYVKFVSIVRPRFVLIENVRGITIEHGKKSRALNRRSGRRSRPYSMRIVSALEGIGYRVSLRTISASDFGVPQRRPRVFFFAELEEQGPLSPDLFSKNCDRSREDFLRCPRPAAQSSCPCAGSDFGLAGETR